MRLIYVIDKNHNHDRMNVCSQYSDQDLVWLAQAEDLYQYWGDLITPPTNIVFKMTGAGDEKGPG